MLNIENFIGHPYVQSSEMDDLIMFHYTPNCVYDKAWDDTTLHARGTIFNKVTGELVARPWRKFFNLNEMPWTYIGALNGMLGNGERFYATKKYDGSMGIFFWYKGEMYITTKGSFYSEQGKWGTEYARKYLPLLNNIPEDSPYTYIFEIIYKENRIVVDYGNFEGLVLTGVVNKEDGHEIPIENLNKIALSLGVPCADSKEFSSVDEIVNYCESLPASEEGFVLTYPSGLKVKIKGEEYLRIHKLISNLTPLAFYEAFSIERKCIPKEYLAQVPEEFRAYGDSLAKAISCLHMDLFNEVHGEYNEIMNKFVFMNIPCTIKNFAIECQTNHKENMSLLISFFKKDDKLLDGIHKRVRPTGNILPDKYKVECDLYGRIKRLQEDN